MKTTRALYGNKAEAFTFGTVGIVLPFIAACVYYLLTQHWFAVLFPLGGIIACSIGLYAEKVKDIQGLPAMLRWVFSIKKASRSGIGLALAILIFGRVFTIAFAYSKSILLPATDIANHSMTQNTPPEGFAILGVVLTTVLLFPFLEELFYRGLLQRFIGHYSHAVIGIVVASTIFTLTHIPAYGGFETPAIALAFPLTLIFSHGILYGWLYHRTQNVVIPWLAHAGWNGIALLLWIA